MMRAGLIGLVMGVTMNGAIQAETPDQAAQAQIAALTGVPAQALQLSPVQIPGLACGLVDALDMRVKGPTAAQLVVQLPEGWALVDSGDMGLRVLDACAHEDSDPRALAGLLAMLHQPRLDALSEVRLALVDTLLRKAGVAFQPPESRREGAAQHVSFMALGPDGQSLLRVDARWQRGNSLTITPEVLATVR